LTLFNAATLKAEVEKIKEEDTPAVDKDEKETTIENDVVVQDIKKI